MGSAAIQKVAKKHPEKSINNSCQLGQDQASFTLRASVLTFKTTVSPLDIKLQENWCFFIQTKHTALYTNLQQIKVQSCQADITSDN